MLEIISTTTATIIITTNLLFITLHRSRCSVDGLANTIRAGRPGFESWLVETGSRDPLVSYSVGTMENGVLSRE
jgi:hypothetical protein